MNGAKKVTSLHMSLNEGPKQVVEWRVEFAEEERNEQIKRRTGLRFATGKKQIYRAVGAQNDI